MIIQPNNDPQQIRTRCRPHAEVGGYLFICWQESSKMYPFLADLDYIDGHIEGEISVLVLGLKNGMKLTTVIYPIIDSEAVIDAIEALRESVPYFGTSEAVTSLIGEQLADLSLLPEIHRGTIFVQSQTDQPYTIT